MELHEALNQIAEIRQQVARTEWFRGYRAVPVAFSGLLAFLAAGAQEVWLPHPEENIGGYLTLWIGAACLSLLATGWEMVLSSRHSSSSLEPHKTFLAVSQFAPCLAAGGLLALVLVRFAPESLWMLPGLWSMLFGLGVLASWRFLPHATLWVGVFYVIAGLVCLILARGAHEFSPLAMGLPFGLGQLFAAAVLYWNLERSHDA